MNLADVMDELGDRLETIGGLRVYRHPPGSVSPPAAVVGYPDEYEFDKTYGRGMDSMSIPLVVVVGKPTEQGTRDRLGAYVNGSGAESFKAVLESGTYTAFDEAVVSHVEFDTVKIAGTDYMAALFTVDIAGKGSMP